MRYPLAIVVTVFLLVSRGVSAPVAEETGSSSSNEYGDRIGGPSASGSPAGNTRGSVSYPLAHLVPRYRPLAPWHEEYEVEGNGLSEDIDLTSEERYKRGGPSLSIVNPLDVLRQRLLLEMARRQMRESSRQVQENRKLMKAIGKRGTFLRQPTTGLNNYHMHSNAIGYDM